VAKLLGFLFDVVMLVLIGMLWVAFIGALFLVIDFLFARGD
jgi:hypothetical protein